MKPKNAPPTATLLSPLAMAFEPRAVESKLLATAPKPSAVALLPLASAP